MKNQKCHIDPTPFIFLWCICEMWLGELCQGLEFAKMKSFWVNIRNITIPCHFLLCFYFCYASYLPFGPCLLCLGHFWGKSEFYASFNWYFETIFENLSCDQIHHTEILWKSSSSLKIDHNNIPPPSLRRWNYHWKLKFIDISTQTRQYINPWSTGCCVYSRSGRNYHVPP